MTGSKQLICAEGVRPGDFRLRSASELLIQGAPFLQEEAKAVVLVPDDRTLVVG